MSKSNIYERDPLYVVEPLVINPTKKIIIHPATKVVILNKVPIEKKLNTNPKCLSGSLKISEKILSME